MACIWVLLSYTFKHIHKLQYIFVKMKCCILLLSTFRNCIKFLSRWDVARWSFSGHCSYKVEIKKHVFHPDLLMWQNCHLILCCTLLACITNQSVSSLTPQVNMNLSDTCHNTVFQLVVEPVDVTHSVVIYGWAAFKWTISTVTVASRMAAIQSLPTSQKDRWMSQVTVLLLIYSLKMAV